MNLSPSASSQYPLERLSQCRCRSTSTLIGPALFSISCSPPLLPRKPEKCVLSTCGPSHISTTVSITTIGPSRNVALSSKRSTTVSTVTTVNGDRHFIDRQWFLQSKNCSVHAGELAPKYLVQSDQGHLFGRTENAKISKTIVRCYQIIGGTETWNCCCVARISLDHQSMRTVSNRDQHRHFCLDEPWYLFVER